MTKGERVYLIIFAVIFRRYRARTPPKGTLIDVYV